MVHIGHNDFKPNEAAVLVNRIRSDELCIREFFKYPSIGGVLRGKVALYLQSTHVLRPSARSGTLLSHPTSRNLYSDDDVTLLCLVAKCPRSVQPRGPFKPHQSGTTPPQNRPLSDFRRAGLDELSPGLRNLPVHWHKLHDNPFGSQIRLVV